LFIKLTVFWTKNAKIFVEKCRKCFKILTSDPKSKLGWLV
jgi:hypothetical protein